jgi:hypothetical protein
LLFWAAPVNVVCTHRLPRLRPPVAGEAVCGRSADDISDETLCKEAHVGTETHPAQRRAGPKHAWMNGYTVFAVSIMLVLGLWQVLAGLTAVVRDRLYVTTATSTYAFDISAWGWTAVLLGVLIAGTGIAVLQGRSWGDATAIVLACLIVVANFLLIPFYPIWPLLIIALAITLLWALTTSGREVA